MGVTIEDIQNKEFTIRPRGCDRFEVDSFLEDIMLQMQTMEEELEELRTKCASLYDTINTYKRTEESIKEILVIAREKGDNIVEKANEEAEGIINDAKAKAEELESGLNAHIAELQAQAEAMKNEYKSYRKKFEDMIKAQLTALNINIAPTTASSPFDAVTPKTEE